MNQESIRVGIIGCGRISGHHCRSIVETPNAELVAVCDLEIERANAYRDAFGVQAFNNYHEMLLKNPQINTVAVITPSGMHFEHVLDIIKRYRKHLIVEKPTFMKPSQLVEAYRTAAEHGVRIFPVFQNRHNKAVQRVLRGMRDGELGRLRTAAVRVRWCRPQRYYDLAPWRGTFAMDGGCLTNQGIHHIDLLRQLGGEVQRVCSSFRTLGADIEAEDTATAVMEFGNGAIGCLEVTTAARPNDYEASLSLVCENGLAQIGGIAVNELQVYTPEPGACAANSEDFSGNVYGNGHAKIYNELALIFQNGNDFSVEYEDALASIKLLNSFYVAEEVGGWVGVSEAGDSSRLGRPNDALANLYRIEPLQNAL
jgi:UDP-N-acetyl-2-amino-2-deoxyglucuronate dehydrogenase